MNRSSRDSALPMQNSLQHRRGRSLSSVVKERDDDLALFYEMRKREKERNSLLLPNSDEFEPSLAATKSGSSPLYKITASTPTRKGGPDDLLNADGDKNDYDWLLTPPGTPLFPSLEMETQAPGMGQRGTPMVRPPPVLRSSREDQVPTRPSASTLQNKRTVKSISSPDSTGFGRTLSKKSLDMALRHMDIRRSTPSSLRPLMTNIPTASLYSVRSGASKSRTASISDSPIATSSNASSEHSVSIVLGQEGSELDDDDFGSERGSRTSPASQQGSIRSKGELASTNWLHSPEFREDKYDREFLFSQGFDHLSDPLEGVASVTSGGADYDSKIRLEY